MKIPEYHSIKIIKKQFNTGKEPVSRYSNNLLTVSPLETIDLEPTESNKKWLFDNYVESLVEV